MVKEWETRAGRDFQGNGTLTWNGKAYGPTFNNCGDAALFVQFVGDQTGLDPYHQTAAALNHLKTKFRAVA